MQALVLGLSRNSRKLVYKFPFAVLVDNDARSQQDEDVAFFHMGGDIGKELYPEGNGRQDWRWLGFHLLPHLAQMNGNGFPVGNGQGFVERELAKRGFVRTFRRGA